MKKIMQMTTAAVLVLAACRTKQPSQNIPTPAISSSTIIPPGACFIPIDSGNKMLSSYLTSIHSASNDSELRSVIINADSLRYMLNSTANGKIAYIKIMLSHTLDYVNGGGKNKRCGYKSGRLTFIVAGYDTSGNYVYYPSGQVMDNGLPCPASCPTVGTAANDLLIY